MRKQITPKKRFQVLERDWFKCRYCGRDATTTVLEIDHIVPVKEWWTNKLDNLLTSCHKCNRWKWSRKLWEKKESYKVKIWEKTKNAKAVFYEKWNNNIMGTIDKKTQSLVSLYFSDFFNHSSDFLDNQWTCSFHKYWSDKNWFSYEDAQKEFEHWWQYCDEVLSIMYDFFCKEEIDYIIEEVFDNNNRNWNSDTDYTGKLNYYLTTVMANEYKKDGRLYVLYKFSLFHKLLDEIQ